MWYTGQTTLSLITLSFACTNICLIVLVGLKYTFNPYLFITLLTFSDTPFMYGITTGYLFFGLSIFVGQRLDRSGLCGSASAWSGAGSGILFHPMHYWLIWWGRVRPFHQPTPVTVALAWCEPSSPLSFGSLTNASAWCNRVLPPLSCAPEGGCYWSWGTSLLVSPFWTP